MERSGRSYCLCNEMSFSHFQHFCEGIGMTTRSFFLLLFFFCFLYCCCAALFWWLHKQPCTVTSGHINPNSTPPPPPNYLFWNSLENILKFIWWLWFLVKHELDSFVDVRTWDKTNDGKSRNLSIVSLKDVAGEVTEVFTDVSVLPCVLLTIKQLKIKPLQTSFTYITCSSISHLADLHIAWWNSVVLF